MNAEDIYKKALLKWGSMAQINMMIEECGELIVALQHRKRIVHSSSTDDTSVDDVLEEMADVEIMIKQLKSIYDYTPGIGAGKSRFEQIKLAKLSRLLKRLT